MTLLYIKLGQNRSYKGRKYRLLLVVLFNHHFCKMIKTVRNYLRGYMKNPFVVLVLIGTLFLVQTAADTLEAFPIAIITKIDGTAKILPADSFKKHKAKVGEGLLVGDTLFSYKDTKVLVTLLDDSPIILNENAELLFSSDRHLNHEHGEIYYRIVKRSKSRGLQVETPFSIIGIKGTEFIVRYDQEGEIALNEGVIGVSSLGEAFELHQKKNISDFEKYQKQQDAEFAEYQRQQEEDFTSYVKQFDLHSNKVIRFKSAQNCKQNCEKQVLQEDFTPEIAKHFKSYQMMIGQ